MPVPGDPRSVASPARRSDRPDPDASLPRCRTSSDAEPLCPPALSAPSHGAHSTSFCASTLPSSLVVFASPAPAPEPGSPRRRLAGTARRAGDSSRSYPAFPEIKDWPASPVRPTGGPSPAPTPACSIALNSARYSRASRPASPSAALEAPARHPMAASANTGLGPVGAICDPATTTRTPRGDAPSCSARATSDASPSGVCTRRANTSATRATLLRPTMVPPEGTYPTWHTP